MPARRVLITGVSNFWGRRLAARLLAESDVEAVIGLDRSEPPAAGLERLEFVEADIRSPAIADLVPGVGADTVVHNDVLQFAVPGVSPRQVHDVNVIGSLQLLAACERSPGVRAIVVRGSAAIYGSEPAAPQFFTEDMARRYPLRTRFQRDIGELESLFGTFSRRRRSVVCTMLRYQPVLGTTLENPITRLLRLPVVPTQLGFDPRMQFIHEDDSVSALAAATLRPVQGAVNVAGEGTVALSRLIAILGKRAVPIAHPLYSSMVGLAERTGALEMSPDTVRFMRYGRGVDTSRLVGEVGYRPRSTLEAAHDIATELRGSPAPAAAT